MVGRNGMPVPVFLSRGVYRACRLEEHTLATQASIPLRPGWPENLIKHFPAVSYRGYTWKQNLAPGEWKIAVETEYGRTVAVYRFKISADPPESDMRPLGKRF